MTPNSASARADLPPGQHRLRELPRFGPRAFTAVSVAVATDFRLRVDGAVRAPLELTLADLRMLPLVEQASDMHCVTTWSVVGVLGLVAASLTYGVTCSSHAASRTRGFGSSVRPGSMGIGRTSS